MTPVTITLTVGGGGHPETRNRLVTHLVEALQSFSPDHDLTNATRRPNAHAIDLDARLTPIPAKCPLS